MRRNFIPTIFVLFSFILSPLFLAAQPLEVSFDRLTTNEGLSNNNATSIVQDKYGFIWIGTFEGLNRYDGYSIKVYENNANDAHSLVHNEITCQYIDHHGNHWIGTNSGISLYNAAMDNFINFPLRTVPDRGISYGRAKGFFEDSDHNLYVGVEAGWIYRYNGKSLEVFDSLRFKDIMTSNITKTNVLAIGSLKGLVLSQLNSTDTTMLLYGKATDYVYVDDKDIWVGVRNGGVYRYNVVNRSLREYSFDNVRKSIAKGFYRDRENNVWITGGALHKYNKKKDVFYDVIDDQGDIRFAETHTFLEDKDGNFWIGVYFGGVRIIRKTKKFNSIKPASDSWMNLSNKVVSALTIDKQRNVWVGYYEGGIDHFNTKTKTKTFIHPGSKSHNLPEASIFFFHQDRDNDLWIGSYTGGLQRYDEQLKRFISYRHDASNPASIAANDIRGMIETAPGNFWIISHSQGLDKFDKRNNIFAHYRQSNPEVKLDLWGFHLIQDRDGVMWYAASSGLFRIDKDGTLTLFNKDERNPYSLSENTVNYVFEDSQRRLWVATINGLNLLDRKTNQFIKYTKNEGLPSNAINSILEDHHGKLWISTNAGLFSLDAGAAEIPSTINIRTYDFSDGLQHHQFYPRACFNDKATGNLYFGGINGITWFHPDSIQNTRTDLKVSFTDFMLFNQPVSIGADDSPLQKHISRSSVIELLHHQKMVTFEYVAPNFIGSKKVQYAYRLAGFNNNWNYVGNERKATYTNLDAGKYVFQVKASVDGITWSDELTEIDLIIHPPWWVSWYAKVFYFFLVVAMLYVYRMVSLRQAKLLHKLRLERVQRENTDKLNQAKLQFFTNVSHEFRTPLTLILGPLQSLLESRKGGKLLHDQLLIINNNAQRLLRLVNQLLDFRKAESGNLQLQVTEEDAVQFLKEIKLSFDPLAEERNISFTFHASSTSIMLWFDREQAEKIFFNLLSNAFKNTPDGGQITVSISEEINVTKVLIEDTGKGIKESHLPKIFQSFFSYSEDKAVTGTGIGLALTKSLVEMHRGTISVSSKENEFTRFTVALLKGKNHFNEKELATESVDGVALFKPWTESVDEESAAETFDVAHRRKVLIVEDHKDLRQYIKSLFPTFNVLEASNGKEGLLLAEEELPDIIISDVMMPEVDGMTLCKEVKKNLKTSHIPVILLTARTSLIYTIEGLEKGADDYLTKPFNARVLQLKVKNILKAHQSMRNHFTDHNVLNIEPKAVVLNSLDEKFVNDILECIEKNISDADFTIDDMSKEIGMSRAQLYRKIKALTGQSANELLRTMRLKRAAQLLKQKQLTVAQVTYDVGFTDLQYFRECFKKYFGVTPSEYIDGPGAAAGVD